MASTNVGKLKAASAFFVQRPVALRNVLLPALRTTNFFNGESIIVYWTEPTLAQFKLLVVVYFRVVNESGEFGSFAKN